MAITHLFAGIGVTEYEPARAWYERLFGRSPDVIPKEDEAVWQLASTGLIYIVADQARAGRGLLTLAVDNLEEHVAQLIERGPSESRLRQLRCQGPSSAIPTATPSPSSRARKPELRRRLRRGGGQ